MEGSYTNSLTWEEEKQNIFKKKSIREYLKVYRSHGEIKEAK